MSGVQSFNITFRKIAHAMAGGLNLRVHFRADANTGSTDGRNIYLPTVLPGVLLKGKEFDYLLGLLYHELGHVKWTQMEEFALKKKDPLAGHLLNLFEDVRIENLYIQHYPGAAYNLDFLEETNTKQAMQDELLHGPVDPKRWDEELAMRVIYAYSWKTYRKTPLTFNLNIDDYPQLTVTKKLIDRHLPNAQRTVDITVLALAVAEELRKMFPQTQKWPDFSKMNDHEFKEWLEKELKKPNGGVLGPGIKFLHDVLTGNDQLKNAILLLNGKGKGGSDTRTWGTRALPPLDTTKDKIFYAEKEDDQAYQAALDALGGDLTALKKATSVFLQSRKKKAWERGLKEGQIDSQALYKIRTGEFERLFKEKRESRLVNTAVEIGIDLSSSMDQLKVRYAAVLLNEAVLAVPRVALDIYGFYIKDTGFSRDGSMKGFGRVGELRIPRFKTFEQSAKQARATIGGIKTDGYTPLGEGMAYGFENLVTRREAKRVLIVVTDGAPYYSMADHDHSDFETMADIKEKCKRNGIIVLGVQIGSVSSMEKYADATVDIHSVTDLAPCCLDLIKRIAEVERR